MKAITKEKKNYKCINIIPAINNSLDYSTVRLYGDNLSKVQRKRDNLTYKIKRKDIFKKINIALLTCRKYLVARYT